MTESVSEDERVAVLRAYASGDMPRSVAMAKLGMDWYGQLVDAMAEGELQVVVQRGASTERLPLRQRLIHRGASCTAAVSGAWTSMAITSIRLTHGSASSAPHVTNTSGRNSWKVLTVLGVLQRRRIPYHLVA